MTNPEVAPLPGEEPSQPAAPPASNDAEAAKGAPQPPGLLRQLVDARATLAFMIALTVIFFICLSMKGQSLRVPFTPEALLKVGAFDYDHVAKTGEWWRLFSALFVSRWALDALFYLWVFFELGPVLEKTLGTFRFCVLYITAGVAGIAIGTLLPPASQTFGAILAIYVLLGGLPGVILGVTGSPSETLKHPATRSAIFWIVMLLVISYFSGGGVQGKFEARIGACAVAALLGAGLGATLRSLPKGLLFSAVGVGLTLFLVGTVVQGKRYLKGPKGWLDGRLVARDAIRPAGDPKPDPAADPHGKVASGKVADTLRAKLAPLFDRYGPLPSGEGVDDRAYETIQQALIEIDKTIEDGSQGVTTELDDLRIRGLLLLARHHQAARIAEEFEPFATTEAHKALVAVAYLFKGGDDWHRKGKERLESLLQDQKLEQRLPEVRYYLGMALFKLQEDDASLVEFRRYLRLVNDMKQPTWRVLFMEQAKAQLR